MNKNDFILSQKELIEYLKSKDIDIEKFAYLEKELPGYFSVVIPKYYLNLINWQNPQDPLLKMVVPDLKEKDIKKYELEDPIGDKSHEPVPGIIHRYPDRLLLMLTSACAVHCRFCFRKNLLKTPSKVDLKKSLEYIKNHKEIWEVIFSGGDPFTIPPFLISKVFKELSEFSHIKIVRFHTRVPAINPLGVSERLINALTDFKNQKIVVIHINHQREITPEFEKCVSLLQKEGIMLLSQTVLMKNINDEVSELKNLFKKLVAVGVKPYYLHHLDKAAGTDYFRVSVKRGKELMRGLRGHISGHCIPEYVIDVPGGYGKIPTFWFRENGNRYESESFEGEKIVYKDEAEENDP